MHNVVVQRTAEGPQVSRVCGPWYPLKCVMSALYLVTAMAIDATLLNLAYPKNLITTINSTITVGY